MVYPSAATLSRAANRRAQTDTRAATDACKPTCAWEEMGANRHARRRDGREPTRAQQQTRIRRACSLSRTRGRPVSSRSAIARGMSVTTAAAAA
eukprot:363402-Chlamydomonas_euryale.AAC.1